MKRLVLFILLLVLSCIANAQLYSNVIANSRAGNNTWTVAGADPTYVNEVRTQCSSTIAAYGTSGTPASAATINTAIKNCAAAHPLSGAGGYVLLGPGDFYINTEITFSTPAIYNNVTLRGSGATQTTIHFSGSATACPFSGGADICMSQNIEANGFGLGYDGSADNSCAWTAGYSQGTTNITIGTCQKGSAANMQIGSLIFLDQTDTAFNPSIPASGLSVCRDEQCGGDNVSGRLFGKDSGGTGGASDVITGATASGNGTSTVFTKTSGVNAAYWGVGTVFYPRSCSGSGSATFNFKSFTVTAFDANTVTANGPGNGSMTGCALDQQRSLTEPQVVTNISGTTITITPGIRMPSWFAAGNAPQMWWNTSLPIQRIGIENMSIDISNALNRFSTNLCLGCYNVWIKGVRFYDTHGDTETGQNGFYHFYPIQSMRVTMQDSYSYGSPPVSNYYVMSCWTSGDELYQNNIRQHLAFGFMAEGCVNWVHGYNFDIDDYYTHCHGCSTDTQWQQASSYRHGGTDALGLYEGDVGIGGVGDLVFGASTHITHYRNFYNGRDPNGGSTGSGKTEQTNAILLYPVNRFWNIIANVFGTAGYHTTYQCAYPSPGTCNNDVQIYSLGYANGYSAADEAYVATSMMRWGNYDTFNHSVQWNTGEVPSGLTDGFANPVPTVICTAASPATCPASFYLGSQPTWWNFGSGTVSPFPGIGPDVTGGTVTSGTGTGSNLGTHVYLNPAANNYLNVMGGPTNGAATLVSFDPSIYYSGSSPANAPTFTAPASCPFTSAPPITVTLSDSNTGTHITCYTTDGSLPVTNGAGTACSNGTQYTTSFTESSSLTVNAVSGTSTLTDSTEASCVLTVPAGTAVTVKQGGVKSLGVIQK